MTSRVARRSAPRLLACMLDAVMLDWETTLVNTTMARREARERALADEGATIDNMRSDPTLADLIELRAQRHFAERLGKGVMLAPGAREFVERIQVGARLAIVTTATRSETEFVLRLAGLDGAASAIIAADDAASNAHQLALDHLAKRRPVLRERSIAIVHSSPGLYSAKLINIKTVAIAAPAHVALEADGAIDHVNGLTLGDLARVAGIMFAEHRS